jgi:hypothetical protein
MLMGTGLKNSHFRRRERDHLDKIDARTLEGSLLAWIDEGVQASSWSTSRVARPSRASAATKRLVKCVGPDLAVGGQAHKARRVHQGHCTRLSPLDRWLAPSAARSPTPTTLIDVKTARLLFLKKASNGFSRALAPSVPTRTADQDRIAVLERFAPLRLQ